MANIDILNDSVYIDRWNYKKPTLKPNKDGDIELVFESSVGPLEWWMWGIDVQGKYFWQYKWCEDDYYSDSDFREEISREELLKKIDKIIVMFESCKLSDYVAIYRHIEECIKENCEISIRTVVSCEHIEDDCC